MSAITYTIPVTITPDDIDFMGHVNNSRYLNWVQDVVLGHWRALAPTDLVGSLAWVALKHEITYRKPAFERDDITARTVLERIAGARAFYHTVIERGEEVLAEVTSMWCCIDAETLRPSRIDRDVAADCFGLPRKQTPHLPNPA